MSVADTVCVNIGPHQRRLRMRMGVVMIAVAAIAALTLVATGAPRSARLVVFVPLLLAALGIFQARAQTCVALAAKGLRNLDHGNERVGGSEAAALKGRARAVLLASILTAAAAAALVTLV